MVIIIIHVIFSIYFLSSVFINSKFFILIICADTMTEKNKTFQEIDFQPVYEYVDKNKIQLIEIKIKKINQLFNSFDPSPFLEKDLDDDAFEYIVSSVEEHPLKVKQKIVIHLPKKELNKINEDEIKRAIHHHFKYRKKISERSIRKKIEEGQLSFIIGIIFLASCLILGKIISNNYNTILSNIIVEGLTISGWVAMWKPISNILYDWWPLNKDKKIYDKIANMDIEFRTY
ncbi:MAG: hypothetical protein KatS3mg002_0554 [Candidatus Woesearchaeota archaeon]|nr:MAG: hypothetical protein KatS3mg002_0554 [Candidatus Woesearchaeota archaeon]